MPFDVLAYANSHVLTGVNTSDAILGGLDLPLRVDSDQLIGDTAVTEVISGVVDLDLIFRHVEMPNLVSKVPAAAWPHDAVAQQTVVPGGGTVPEVNVIVISGLAAAPANGGVEAWAGNIAGTIPLGFREVVNPPRVEYRWLFTDAEGVRLSAEAFTVSAGSLQSAALSVAFRPDVVEWPSGLTDVGGLEPTRVVGVQVEVRVRLEQTGQDSGWIAIPGDPIPVGILPLPLPAVAAMFRNPSFGGDSVLLMVPADSPFGSAGEVVDAVAAVAALAGRLQAAASLAAWAAGISGLVAAVSELANRFPSYKHVGWRKQNELDDLGKYNFISVDWWWDTDIEDRASSLLVISPARQISFYEHDDQGGKRLTVDARALSSGVALGAAVLPNLHLPGPASVPPGTVATTGHPGHSAKWGDAISSYRWG